MHARPLVFCALGLLVSGCYNWRAGVAQTAALQHDCPEDQVQVLADNGDGYARVVQLDVCGQRRVYQDLGGRSGYAWVDTTPQTAGGEAAVPTQMVGALVEPPPSTSTAASSDPFADSVRARIEERRSGILACTGGAVAIEATWGSSGVVAIAARNVADVAVAQCIGAAIGTIDVPTGFAPGRILHPVAP